ncbi:hypothetical protein ACIQUW_33445 [Streptomyces sp. NPDC101117]
MTGPEFAAAHGSDSSNWTPADFEALEVLADIDRYASQTTDDYQPAA